MVNTTDFLTLFVAAGTLALAYVTWRQGRTAKSALDLSIRPFLGDPSPIDGETERLQFGPPGRIDPEVPHGRIYWRGADGSGTFHLSVPFENIGAGVATILEAETEPQGIGSVYISRKFVPVGAIVRVNIAVLLSVEGMERFNKEWWAMDGFAVWIRYTDANGGQPMTSRAVFREAATQAPWVSEIEVYREGESEPFAVGQSSF